METEVIKIEGMSCNHCVMAVREALEGVDGVQIDDVQIGTAKVTYDPARTERAQLVDAIEEEGYDVVG